MKFSSNFFQPLVLVQSVTIAKFLSSLGGIMGFVAGMSVLSFIEILFHVVSNIRLKDSKIRPAQITGPERGATTLSSKTQIWHQLSIYLVGFLSSSSAHGLHYIQSQRHTRPAKIFWAIQVVLSIAVCSVLVRNVYKHAERSPVIVSIDQRLMTLEDVRNFFFK
jgi:phosphoglycerol transferase MdoB-like AlkP superfamily enzyme